MLVMIVVVVVFVFVLFVCNSGLVIVLFVDVECVDGGMIVYVYQQELQCFFGGWIEQVYIFYQFLDNLFFLIEDGEVVLWLVEDWMVSEDGFMYMFMFKDGVEFIDGIFVDVEVVVYNFDYWVVGGNSIVVVWFGGYYEFVEVVDDFIVVIYLFCLYLCFIENLMQGYFGIQLQQVLEICIDEENCEQLIGLGVFVVQEWNCGENVVFVCNDEYILWLENVEYIGLVYVEKVDWWFVVDGVMWVLVLCFGEVDVIYGIFVIEWDGLDGEQYELYKYVMLGWFQQILFNMICVLFDDENLCKVFIFSFDCESIVDMIGYGVIFFEGNGGVSQVMFGYSQKVVDWYVEDIDEVNCFLDEVGWIDCDGDGYWMKEGKIFEVVFFYNVGIIINVDGVLIFQVVQEQVKVIGFKVDLIFVLLFEIWVGIYSGFDFYDILVGYWILVNVGILYINWCLSIEDDLNYLNSVFYDSFEFEFLILVVNFELDVDVQNVLYGQVQEYIVEYVFLFGLYDCLSMFGVNLCFWGVWQEYVQGGFMFYDVYFVE